MGSINSVTMKDIAKSLNVSITTISKVINGHSDIGSKTRSEVMAKIAEKGYVPNMMATNLRRSKANMVALVLSDISKPYFGRVIEGYENTLGAAGYQTMTFSSMEQGEREEHFIHQIASVNMAGIIIDPVQDSDPEKKALKQIGIPYVFSNRFLDEKSDYYVAADNDMAGYLGVTHLLERWGGRPVVCVNGPSRISPTIKRFAGYRRALEEAGVGFNPNYVYDNCFGLNDAFEIGMKIASAMPRPFSVFCSTDQIAVGVLRALYEKGLRTPQDAAVIGVDDIDMAQYLTPALSTVSLPKESIGRASAQMLIDLIEGKSVDNPRILLEPELIARETT